MKIRYGVSRRRPDSKIKSDIEYKNYGMELEEDWKDDDEYIRQLISEKHPGWQMSGYAFVGEDEGKDEQNIDIQTPTLSPCCLTCGEQAVGEEHPFRCETHMHCDTCKSRDKEALLYRAEDNKMSCKVCYKKEVDETIASFNGDTTNTYKILCPWCGEEAPFYVYEKKHEKDLLKCTYCDNIYLFEHHYSTEKIENS